MELTELERELLWIINGIIALVLLVLIVHAIFIANDFSKELRYINMEIQRTEGAERRYWKRKKKELWLSLIPFWKG